MIEAPVAALSPCNTFGASLLCAVAQVAGVHCLNSAFMRTWSTLMLVAMRVFSSENDLVANQLHEAGALHDGVSTANVPPGL
jgi:hypothetical protein